MRETRGKGSRRLAVALAVLAIVAALLVLLRPRGTHRDASSAGAPPPASTRAGSPAPAAIADDGGGTGAVVASRTAGAEPGASARVLFRDLSDGGPVGSLEFEVGDAPANPLVSDAAGFAALPGPGPWDLRLRDPAWRLLREARPTVPAGGGDIWVCRHARVRGTVRTADGQPLPAGAKVVGAPSATAADSRRTVAWSPESVQWRRDRPGPGRGGWIGSAESGAFDLELPALDGMVLVASAPGHESQARTLDLRGMAGGVRDVEFTLRRSGTYRVRVVDEDGHPIERARVAVWSLVVVPNEEAAAERERMAAAGFPRGGAWSSDQLGVTTFTASRRGITDATGAVEFPEDVYSGITSRVAIVSGENHAALRMSADDLADAWDRPVVLRRIRRDGDYWQLTWDGAPLVGEATVSLGVVIDDAVSTSGGGSFVIENGRLPRSAAEPGETRVLTVAVPGRPVRDGRVTLPPSGSIEIARLTTAPE